MSELVSENKLIATLSIGPVLNSSLQNDSTIAGHIVAPYAESCTDPYDVPENNLSGILSIGPVLNSSLQNKNVIEGRIVRHSERPESYAGPYDIIPRAYNSQNLDTAGKYMEENVTVRQIPFYQVSNVSGDTIYIGSEV